MAEAGRDIIVVGASAGGVQALQRLAAGLPADLPAAVFIVLHVWPDSPSMLAPILERCGPLPAKEAVDGEGIQHGRIYIAPSDLHLFVDSGRVHVVRGPKENRTRPAINPLFRSAAAAYRNRVIGVILTGTLDDGSAGLWAIKQCGGIAIVQSDPQFGEMPRSALENVQVDFHVPLDQIPPLLARLAREPLDGVPSAPVPEIVRFNNQGAKMENNGISLDAIGPRSAFSCPECNGALWELDEGRLQYRCHVGHAFSAEVLNEAQNGTIEQSLWSALRGLKESAALDERLATRSEQHGLEAAAAAHRAHAQRKQMQADELQRFLGGRLRPAA